MILLLILTWSNCLSQCDDVIRFEHIGESDKPIPTIVLCVSTNEVAIDSAYTKYFHIDEKLYSTVANYVTANDTLKGNESKEFGSFKVSVIASDTISLQYNIGIRKNSVDFFEKLLKVLAKAKGTDAITAELETLLRRIG